MTDLMKLIAADRPVRLMPDATTADDLRKLDDFWSGRAVDRPERELPAVSDQEMRAALAGGGVDARMPDAVRNAVRGGRHVRLAPLALAACLVGVVAIGSILWLARIPDGITATTEKGSAAYDPYVLARPDRPAAGIDQSQEQAPGSGLQAAAVRGAIGVVDDLTRAEVHEMQRLLTRLGYGPLVVNGLPSKALGDAISRFRIDQGLDPGDQQLREVLVMLRLSARVEALRAPRDGVSDK